jgi:hypothetical protein
MRDRAIVYLPDRFGDTASALRVAGRPVLFRTLMTLVRGGINRIGLPGVLRDGRSDHLVRGERRLQSVIVWLDRLAPDERAAWTSASLPLIPVNVLLDPISLGRLLDAPESAGGIALEESKGTLSPVLLAPPDLLASLWDRLAAGDPLGEELDIHLRQNRMSLVPGSGQMIPVTDEASRSHAEDALYRSLGTEADSAVRAFSPASWSVSR